MNTDRTIVAIGLEKPKRMPKSSEIIHDVY